MLEEDIVSQYLVHSHVRVEEQKDSSPVFPGKEEPSHQVYRQTGRTSVCTLCTASKADDQKLDLIMNHIN